MSSSPILEWTSFPFRDYPKKSAILVTFLLILAAVLWNLTVRQWQMPMFYYLGLLFVVLEISPYFTITNYKFYDDEIVIKYVVFSVVKKYSDFSCFYFDKTGVMLSPFVRPRRLDRFRGNSIRFSKDSSEKEQLTELLKKKIGKQF